MVTIESVQILRSQILVVPGDNYRTDLGPVEEMATLLERSGQLSDIGVIIEDPPGPNGEIYRLTYGFRRIAGWDHLGWGDSKPIRAALKRYDGVVPMNVILDNWDANHHVPVHPYDQGRLIVMLEAGSRADVIDHHGSPEKERAALTPAEVQEKLRLTDSQYRKLRQLERGTDVAVRAEAREHGAPMRILYKIACIKGEGESEGEKLRSRQMKQEAVLNHWLAKKNRLAEDGRQRARKGDADEAGGSDTDDSGEDGKPAAPKPIVSAKKQLDDKGRSARLYLEALERKRDTLKSAKDKEARARIEGAISVLGFFLGDTKQFSKELLREDDFKALQKALVSEANGAGHTTQVSRVAGKGLVS